MTLSRPTLATSLLSIGLIAFVARAETPSTTTPTTVRPAAADHAVPPPSPPASSGSAATEQPPSPTASGPGPWRRPLEEGVYLAAFDENWDFAEIEDPAPLPMCINPYPNVVKFVDCCRGTYVYQFCNCFPARMFSVCNTQLGQITPPNVATHCGARLSHPLFPGWSMPCTTSLQ